MMAKDTDYSITSDAAYAGSLVEHILRGLAAAGATTRGGLCEELKAARITTLSALILLDRFEGCRAERSAPAVVLNIATNLLRHVDDPRMQASHLRNLADEIGGMADDLEYDADRAEEEARREPPFQKHTFREMV
jgi:hypothetical protein